MTRVNYKSDFDFLITPRLAGADPEAAPEFPAFDWVATIYTISPRCAYTASSIGGKLTNCFDDNGRIHIVVDSHALACGRVNVEFKALIPDVIFPDGTRDTYRIDPVDIELVPGNGDEPSDVEISTVLPIIKGDPGKDFTYDDFTPEQLDDLRRPATEAAACADTATQEAKAAANEAAAAAQSANSAAAMATRVNDLWEANERTRQAQETERQTEEQQRRNAEAERADAATLADNAEKLRQQAETIRTRQETARQSAEQLRAGAENLRISEEEARIEAETARALAEQKREAAEQHRTSGEQQRSEAEALRVEADSRRADNETSRQLMEQKRVAAEEQRAAEFAGFRDTLDAKLDSADLRPIPADFIRDLWNSSK